MLKIKRRKRRSNRRRKSRRRNPSRARRRTSSRRRRTRRRNPATAFTIPRMTEVSDSPVRGIIPKAKDLAGGIGTILGGGIMFMGSHALGVAIGKLLEKVPNVGETGTALIKFGGRWVLARGVASTVFTQRSGLLSKDNGRFLVNISLIAGGIALLRDLQVVEKLPDAVQPYVPNLAGYDAGVRRGSLSRARRLRSYDRGIHRGSLSSYDSGVRSSSLSAYDAGVSAGRLSTNFDNMPVETVEQPNYGVPFGA